MITFRTARRMPKRLYSRLTPASIYGYVLHGSSAYGEFGAPRDGGRFAGESRVSHAATPQRSLKKIGNAFWLTETRSREPQRSVLRVPQSVSAPARSRSPSVTK